MLSSCVLKLCTFLRRALQNNNVKSPKFAWSANGKGERQIILISIWNSKLPTYVVLKLRCGFVNSKYILAKLPDYLRSLFCRGRIRNENSFKREALSYCSAQISLSSCFATAKSSFPSPSWSFYLVFNFNFKSYIFMIQNTDIIKVITQK